MKIKYLTEDGVLAIRSNAENVYKNVISGKKQSLEEFFQDDSLIKYTPYEIEDFSLDVSQPKEKNSLTDAENVQRVYNHLKLLSDSQASDERIWAAFTYITFKEYMEYRWPCEDGATMKNRYLFNYSPQRSLFRNGIARLWWIGRVTYDANRIDPYELTKFLCSNQDYIETLCGRNMFNNPTIQFATIDAIHEASKDGKNINREVVRNVAKYMNLLAGTYILDILEYNELKEKISKKIEELQEAK